MAANKMSASLLTTVEFTCFFVPIYQYQPFSTVSEAKDKMNPVYLFAILA